MSLLRILALSDIPRWQGYEALVDETAPDAVVLPGDLVSDGYIDRDHILQHIPAYRDEFAALTKRYGAKIRKDGRTTHAQSKKPGFIDAWQALRETHEAGPDFEKALTTAHVEPFYLFLAHAGKKAKVLVTKGDHDDDIPENYQTDRINQTPGCQEVSGRLVTLDGVAFLGLGFDHGAKISQVRLLGREFANRADVVVCHPPQKMVPRIVDELKPKLLVRGHFGNGAYLVNGTPAVFTQNAHHTLIEYTVGKIPAIEQFAFAKDGKATLVLNGKCVPAMSPASQWDMYPWLKPYPMRELARVLTPAAAEFFRRELENAAEEEIPEVDPRKPSTVTDDFYTHAVREPTRAPYPESTERSGKWLVFVPRTQIDAVWDRIATAVREGRLGGHAKVSTSRPNRLSNEPERHVICVYTYDAEDKTDVDRVRAELRTLGITDRIPYKTDQATYQGKYRVAGSQRISKYYE